MGKTNVMSDLADRYAQVRQQISKSSVTLIAVSKLQPLEKIIELYELGHRDFGENHVQELVRKARALEDKGLRGIEWHMIGHLQTNKIKKLVPFVSAVHTIDSERVASELCSAWTQAKRHGKLKVFIEVNIDG